MGADTRTFKKLRISLTDTCNLACTYCVPEKLGLHVAEKESPHLNTDDYLHIVKQLHSNLHLTKIRLTGGEPLLYFDIENLITGLKNLGINDIGMTSNGYFLKNRAEKLKSAGLSHINISLDALNDDLFKKMTRKPYLKKTLEGIDAALNTGFDIKLNTVVLKGINENQILPLLKYGMERGIPVRFLELMKMGYLHHSFHNYYFSQNDILSIIQQEYDVVRAIHEPSSTANYWQIENANYQFGIIANESEPFCSDCDRLRLDSYGNLFGCISAAKGIPVLAAVNRNESLTPILAAALKQKQKLKFIGSELSMQYLGG
jgi:cyclic pyranopterin phosphate synthase